MIVFDFILAFSGSVLVKKPEGQERIER